MAKTPDQPMILFHIEWMVRYEGLDEKVLNPGFEWVQKGGEPHEAFNFRVEKDGRCYGFVQVPKNKSINIDRLGMPMEDEDGNEFVDGVTAVWVARHPKKGGLRVVGWYRNARVYRYQQPCPHAEERAFNDGWNVYSVCADAANVTFRDEKSRKIPDLSGLNDTIKQTMQFYISEKADPDIRDIEQRIWTAILGERGERKAKPRPGNGTVDAERRKQIEVAAIACAKAHYRALGYRVKSVEHLNCGFDLTAAPPDGKSLCIEVKGRSVPDICADFSVNEYKHIRLMQKGDFRKGEYVICIVTNALDKATRTLHDFRWLKGKWRHSETNAPLVPQELRAVRFYAEGVEATD